MPRGRLSDKFLLNFPRALIAEGTVFPPLWPEVHFPPGVRAAAVCMPSAVQMLGNESESEQAGLTLQHRGKFLAYL